MGKMTQPTVLKQDQASIPAGPLHHVTILQHTIYIIQWYTKHIHIQKWI